VGLSLVWWEGREAVRVGGVCRFSGEARISAGQQRVGPVVADRAVSSLGALRTLSVLRWLFARVVERGGFGGRGVEGWCLHLVGG